VCNGDGIRLHLKLDWALILLRKIYKLKSLQIKETNLKIRPKFPSKTLKNARPILMVPF
jgi:hypothetical protein